MSLRIDVLVKPTRAGLSEWKGVMTQYAGDRCFVLPPRGRGWASEAVELPIGIVHVQRPGGAVVPVQEWLESRGRAN